jgi:hypothetical protein
MTPDYITFYGRRYARTTSLLIATIFDHATANGTYKATAKGIYFADITGKERAFVRRDGLGPVSVSLVDIKGKPRRVYMQSTATKDDAWLGAPESHGARREAAINLAHSTYSKEG